MMDTTFETSPDIALAKNILHSSIALQGGESIFLHLIGLNGITLLQAMVEEARSIGAHPFVKIDDTEIQRMLIEQGDLDFWTKQTQVDQLPLMRQMNAYIGIRASENIYETSQASKEAYKAYSEYFLTPVHFEQRVNHTRWCVMRYPSPAFAMNAKMPTRSFADFYYKACLLDYNRLREAMKPLEERLKKGKEIRLVGEGTDIQFSIEGQNWIPCFGERNIPDGELFSSPLLHSVHGTIRYAPSVYQGKPFEFVELTVKDGVVIDFNSSDNASLEAILNTDEGARRFGEFSFGLNPVITTPMYDILFDEKIYGSNHLTLGNDYEIAANGNQSSIHWDLVCIGADVYLDGECIRKGRHFCVSDLIGLNPEHLL
jgi:aminopeptidase